MPIPGINTIRTHTNNIIPINGRIGLTIWVSGVLLIAATTKRIPPTGGVRPAVSRATQKIMEKCSGSMPNCIATGMRIGTSIIIVADGSIKQPAIKEIRIIIKRNTIG